MKMYRGAGTQSLHAGSALKRFKCVCLQTEIIRLAHRRSVQSMFTVVDTPRLVNISQGYSGLYIHRCWRMPAQANTAA